MTTISSYEAAKLAFTEVFVSRSHIVTQIRNPSHNTTLSATVEEKDTAWRLATDIQFLSILENQARLKGEAYFADMVLENLNTALLQIEEQLSQETFYRKMFAPFTAQYLIAFIFVQKFNMVALESNGYLGSASTVNRYLPALLNSVVESYQNGITTWSANLFGPGSGTLTYEQLAKDKRHILASNGIKRFANSLNVYSIIGGALGLYGALLSEVNPNQYEHRAKIVTLGKLAIEMSESGNSKIGHLNNIGGAREDGGLISTGYASWVARGLAQMATGTTFELVNPNSMFLKEANLIKQGLLTVLSRKGYMPDKFRDFNGNGANTNGGSLAGDKTIFLYELAWCGDQATINTIEKHLAVVYGLGTTNPIIIDSLLTDDVSSGSYAHRALAGLTAAMIKSLDFNYGDEFVGE
ncbi:hypothetical protein [Pseudoneobacillus sp. C159]